MEHVAGPSEPTPVHLRAEVVLVVDEPLAERPVEQREREVRVGRVARLDDVETFARRHLQ